MSIRLLKRASLGLWELYVWPFIGAKANVGWSTISVRTTDIFNATLSSSGAQNEEVEFDVTLEAGTYTIEGIWLRSSNSGIADVALDGVSVGTMDMYNATDLANSRRSVTGVVVATGGKKTLRLKMATKNASSTNYAGYLNLITLRRTA